MIVVMMQAMMTIVRKMKPSDESFTQEKDEIEEIKLPLEYFRQFWPDDINELVAQQTNL